MYVVFLASLGHIRNNLLYITDNFPKQYCFVFLISSAASTDDVFWCQNSFYIIFLLFYPRFVKQLISIFVIFYRNLILIVFLHDYLSILPFSVICLKNPFFYCRMSRQSFLGMSIWFFVQYKLPQLKYLEIITLHRIFRET